MVAGFVPWEEECIYIVNSVPATYRDTQFALLITLKFMALAELLVWSASREVMIPTDG